ncbi:GGDEF domain-containing protein [Alteromonas facilis]|uniref:GGDEF domain-containing protein n=1 Tax=Alteromonas facilis TaxID=2048004 RepID=UPI000C286F20|nr:GGDEF domain-containing protein [Alteromonas facilis]
MAQSRQSIRTITNILLGLFVTLFVVMIGFSYRQLSDTEASYQHIAENVVPTLADNGILHSQLTALAFLVSKFAQSQSAPEMRVNQREVNEKVEEIYRLLDADNSVQNDLQTVQSEFEILKDAMTQTLSLQRVANSVVDNIMRTIAVGPTNTLSQQYDKQQLFALHMSITRLFHADRLIDLRNQQSKILAEIERIQKQGNVPQSINAYIEELKAITFADEGYTSIKSKILREKARIEGQSNFIRRFVLDIAKDAEFRAYQFAEQQSQLTSNFAQTTSQKFSVTLMVYTVTFLIGLVLILFIKFRVVSRLVALNELILKQAKRAVVIERTSEKDEIGTLTNTIAHQFDTIEHQKNELTQLSFIDSLTKIANRRAFNEHLEQILPVATRNKIPVSILLIDVDYFKQYNDEYGHVKGDETLFAVAQALESMARRGTDFIARYGGEEFVGVLLGPTMDEAREFAEQICTHIRQLNIQHRASGGEAHLTVSIGVCTENQPESAATERMIHSADTALYKAKTQGRDQVVVYSE